MIFPCGWLADQPSLFELCRLRCFRCSRRSDDGPIAEETARRTTIAERSRGEEFREDVERHGRDESRERERHREVIEPRKQRRRRGERLREKKRPERRSVREQQVLDVQQESDEKVDNGHRTVDNRHRDEKSWRRFQQKWPSERR